MSEVQSIEQRIAAFLDENNIQLIPSSRGNYGIFSYIQHLSNGKIDLGETVYHLKTGRVFPNDLELLDKRTQLQGFSSEVLKPMITLLSQVEGNRGHQRMKPIYEAIAKVGSRY